MPRKTKKQIITEAVLDQLHDPEISADKAISQWWFTKSSAGLRLTPFGDRAFRQAKIEFFDLPLTRKKTPTSWYSFIMETNNKLSCPYYLGVNEKKEKENTNKEPYIRLYDSKIAMLMSLYGDIYSYLESIKVPK